MIVCAAVLLAAPLRAEPVQATVTYVVDGDTVWLRAEPSGRRFKLRLQGLDAPERCQAHGDAARAALATRVQGRRVTAETVARDDHERAIGTLRLDGADVGARLVAEGHAWSARWRGDPGLYATEEAAARKARRGLFAAAEPETPRDFRRRHGPCR